MGKIYKDITETIGRTPLVKLKSLAAECRADLAIKCEFFNPLGSIKDRIALSMITDAEKKGLVKADTVFVEPTSGNTGIGLACVCASRGYSLVIVMPESMSIERRKLLKALGAKVILSPSHEGMSGSIKKAEEIAESIPGSIILHQFSNPANPQAHREKTAREIWDDSDGLVAAFVAGVGTGGTIIGVGEALKKFNSEIKVIAVEPEGSPVLSGGKPGVHGIQGIGAGFVPDIYNPDVVDEIIKVSDKDAEDMARHLAREEGILTGISTGANFFAALKVAGRAEFEGKWVVFVGCDTGERYLSTGLFPEE